MALIEGAIGIGKTKAIEQWCAQHPGQARYVSLRGITNKTTFFTALAVALGVQIPAKTISDIQARVEDALHNSGLLIIIDEAQFALPCVDTVRKQPELLDWIYTACSNFGVPVALVTTALFAERVRKIEERVLWNGDRFLRRMRPHIQLPDRVCKADMIAVARSILPYITNPMLNVLIGYAGPSDYQLTNLVDAVADAQDIASGAGRERINLSDIQAAINEVRIPSDLRTKQIFKARPARGRLARREQPVQEPFNAAEEPLKPAVERNEFADDMSAHPRLRPAVHSGRTSRDLVTT